MHVWIRMSWDRQCFFGLCSEQPMLRYILLWLTFVLLAIYCVVIVTLILLKKVICFETS